MTKIVVLLQFCNRVTDITWLKNFVNNPAISWHLKPGILEQLNNPIKFQRPTSCGSASATYGFEATILIDICDAVLTANKTRPKKVEKTQFNNLLEGILKVPKPEK